MNRAIALGEVEGPGAALAVLQDLDLDDYHLFHAARADLLRRLGRLGEAARAYARAADLAPSDAEHAFLLGRTAVAARSESSVPRGRVCSRLPIPTMRRARGEFSPSPNPTSPRSLRRSRMSSSP